MAKPTDRPTQHVAIVGGGAAGMSCAATLVNHPDKFKVTIFERNEVLGGQATSTALDEPKHGASWMNNGVQGGSKIFKHTFNFFNEQGSPPQEVKLQVSFGKGVDEFWTNVFPSTLVQKHASDIRRFGRFLTIIKWALPLIGIIPISVMLRLFFFKKDFGDKMVYPLIALFLGTGNQTASVPCGIVERLFNDPNMKLWDYDSSTLLPNLPTMYTFDNLHQFYKKWADYIKDRGANIRTRAEVCTVLSRSKTGVKLRIKNLGNGDITDEDFDDLVLCTLADDSLRILGKEASWRERFVLNGAAFYDDVTVTHSDAEYFEKYYETHFQQELCANPKTEAQEQQITFAKGSDFESKGFRPMYFTHTYKENPRLIEMSFNCSNYQHQLVKGQDTKRDHIEPVYQTIFLDKKQESLWTIHEIDETKIIKRNSWHQLGHKWQHYLRVVPGMMFLNGKNRTLYAGSWTLVNMHEIACVSGIAAAYRLGANYNKFDEFASKFFAKYLLLSHGLSFSREERRRTRNSG
ncbi:hypothetical protein ED733_003033 [Metarhizium rileyi]|uniref:Flavin-containing amine oxidasedehydrogenase n=1 Tax=Metarhizium rileyi (strain RCEF 4871) TaxID=1649241 RepID=A0A5C6G6E9_METRR|nr:hypothetical protein ED733_003033 [Metarhizium rileyi]